MDTNPKITVLDRTHKLVSEILARVHPVALLLKRWLSGPHQGAVGPMHLANNLDEITFRFNRRKSKNRGDLFYRLLPWAVDVDSVSWRDIAAGVRPKITEVYWASSLPNLPSLLIVLCASGEKALAFSDTSCLRVSAISTVYSDVLSRHECTASWAFTFTCDTPLTINLTAALADETGARHARPFGLESRGERPPCRDRKTS